MKKKAVKFLIVGVLGLLCLGSAGKATYLSGKAWVAQLLLNRAWANSVTQETSIKPWPWADIHPVAKLEVPKLEREQIVLAGHSGEAMAFGPGLIQREQSYILAGHRDSHFAFLAQLEPGDEIVLTLRDGKVRRAAIRDIQIFDVNEHPELIAPSGSISLITCYPFDAIQAGGPLRYLITAYY